MNIFKISYTADSKVKVREKTYRYHNKYSSGIKNH